jgi:hypothetical protein
MVHATLTTSKPSSLTSITLEPEISNTLGYKATTTKAGGERKKKKVEKRRM